MSVFVWQNVCLKFGAYYITGERGKFIIKMLLTAFMNFDHFFIVFYHRICIFIIFISFFDKVSNFRNIILTNQKHELVVSYCQWNCMKYMVYQDCLTSTFMILWFVMLLFIRFISIKLWDCFIMHCAFPVM